jgi:hypothetical protein
MRFRAIESSTLHDRDRHAATVKLPDSLSWRYRAAGDIRLFLPAAHVAASIPHLVAFEMRTVDTLGRLGFFPALRQRALIAVFRMVTIIYMALKLVGAMKPRASTYEDIAGKPFGSVVARGRAVIGSDVIVTIGTLGGLPRC